MPRLPPGEQARMRYLGGPERAEIQKQCKIQSAAEARDPD